MFAHIAVFLAGLAVCCSASGLEELTDNNCRDTIGNGNCDSNCAFFDCFITRSRQSTSFPTDGFCEVYNTTHEASVPGLTAYTAFTEMCLSSDQGAGIGFNWQGIVNYDAVYRESQSATVCKHGRVVNGVVSEQGEFPCPATAQNSWHRFSIRVNSDGTFQATVENQDGSTGQSGNLNSYHTFSPRATVLMINDGGALFGSEDLRFSSVDIIEEDVDDCASNPCLNSGTCNDIGDGYECTCQPGYSGTNCETRVEVDCYACSWNSATDPEAYKICVDDPATLGTTVSCAITEPEGDSNKYQCYYTVTYDKDTVEPLSIHRNCGITNILASCRNEQNNIVCGAECSTELCNSQDCTNPPYNYTMLHRQ